MTASHSVSIIIPVYNEAQFIERCLGSVFQFETQGLAYEVLVVDGGSTDGTSDTVANWSERFPQVRLLKNPGRTAPRAMNIGIRAAEGQYIMRLDAHSEYPSNYLRLCFDTCLRTEADNVGGVCITRPRGRSFEARLVQAVTTHRFGVGNAEFRLNAAEGEADTVPYGFFRRDVFERIGFFDERLIRNQDYELNRRLVSAGGRIWLNPAIQVHYYNQPTIRGLYRQAFSTGQWNAWMWRLAPYTFAPRHLIPGIFSLTLPCLLLLGFASPIGIWLLCAVLVLYFFLAAFAAIQQSIRYRQWLLFPVLPIAFLGYHLAYGFGILSGATLLLLRQSPVQRASEP
jgi:glycosyltransferase involved in cell wall biosynthesis